MSLVDGVVRTSKRAILISIRVASCCCNTFRTLLGREYKGLQNLVHHIGIGKHDGTPPNTRLAYGVQLQVNDGPPPHALLCWDRFQFASHRIGPFPSTSVPVRAVRIPHGDWKRALSLCQPLYPYSRAMMYYASSSLGSRIPAIGSNEWYRLSAAGSPRRNA